MSADNLSIHSDTSRPAATGGDTTEYILTIEEVADRYAKAGHPRTIRTIQRYCVSGHLDAQKIATTLGDKYLVTSQSVARHIAQIEELTPLDIVAANRGQPRPAATDGDNSNAVAVQDQMPNDQLAPATSVTPERQEATSDDISRQQTSPLADVSRYVERLQKEVENANDERDFYREQSKDERTFYREQLDRKDKTIDSLLERDRETNILVRGLQEMLRPLLRPARRDPPQDHELS